MAKITLNEKEKELDTDLWIIMIVSFISFVVFMIFQKDIYGFIKNEKVPILSRVLLAATFQYGLAGFGITIVSILRKESFYIFDNDSQNLRQHSCQPLSLLGKPYLHRNIKLEKGQKTGQQVKNNGSDQNLPSLYINW